MIEFVSAGKQVEKAVTGGKLDMHTAPDGGPGGGTAESRQVGGAVLPKRKLTDLDVHFVSLVPAAANQRAFLVKEAGGRVVIEKQIRIAKTDAATQRVFGIVYAPGEVDTEGDTMDAADIQKAAYAFMAKGRTGQVDADHDSEAGKGYIAESWIVRRGDPVFPDEPEGAWAVAIQVTDSETWGRVEKGELTGLSMAGWAKTEPVEAPAPVEAVESIGKSGGLIAALRKALGMDGPATEPDEPGQNQPQPETPRDTAAGPVAAFRAVLDGEMVEKGFGEKYLSNQMWTITDALGAAIRDAMKDDEITDKVGEVEAIVAEFVTWLKAQMGEAGVTKGVAEDTAAGAEVAALRKQLEAKEAEFAQLARMAQDLTARIDAIERQTLGRQAQLGGPAPLEKRKGYRGIRIV